MNLSEKLKSIGVKQVLKYVDKDFEHNAVKVCDWLIDHDKDGGVKNEATMVRNVLQDPDSNWYQLVKSLYTEIDDEQRKRLLENFVINACLIGTPTGFENSVRYDCNVPWAILRQLSEGTAAARRAVLEGHWKSVRTLPGTDQGKPGGRA